MFTSRAAGAVSENTLRTAVSLCFLVLWGWPALAWSQDRVSATEADEIELSNVEIYGKRKAEFVMFGDKMTSLTSLSFPARLPPKTRETGNIEQTLDIASKRFVEAQSYPVTDGLWVFDAQVGSFLHHELCVRRADQLSKASYLLELQHRMGRGHVDSSAHRGESIGVHGIWGPSPSKRFALDLGFQDGAYELWGRAGRDKERSLREFQSGAEASWFFAESTDLAFGTLLERSALSDDNETTTEYQWDSHGAVQSVWKSILVQGQLRYRRGVLDQDAGKENSRLLALEVEGRRTFSRFGVLIGLNSFGVRDYDGKRRNRAYPQLELSYSVSESFHLRLFYHPEVKASSFRGAYLANPYVQLGTFLPCQDKRIAAGLGATLHAGETLTSEVVAGYEEQEGYPVWADSVGLWGLQRDRSVRTRKASFDLRWQPVQRLLCKVSGTVQQADFLASSPGEQAKEVPYVPDFFADSEIRIGPYRDFTARMLWRQVGERPAGQSGDPSHLDAYTLVVAELSRTWGPHLRFLVSGKNLLDQSYAIWQGYTMPGRTGCLGMEARW